MRLVSRDIDLGRYGTNWTEKLPLYLFNNSTRSPAVCRGTVTARLPYQLLPPGDGHRQHP